MILFPQNLPNTEDKRITGRKAARNAGYLLQAMQEVEKRRGGGGEIRCFVYPLCHA